MIDYNIKKKSRKTGLFRHAGQTVEKASGFRFVGFVAVQRYGRVRQSGKQLKMPVFAGIFSYCFAVDTAYFFIDYYSIAVMALYRQSERRCNASPFLTYQIICRWFF